MEHNKIIEALESIPAGRFFRISYSSELPVKAAHKKAGVSVIKVVETTVRTGVSYNNIGAVKEYKATHEPKRTTPVENNWEWVIKDKVKYNSKTDKTYAVIALVNGGHNTKSHYIVTDTNGTREVEHDALDRSLIIDSYWNKGDYVDAVRTIAFNNIIDICI